MECPNCHREITPMIAKLRNILTNVERTIYVCPYCFYDLTYNIQIKNEEPEFELKTVDIWVEV